MDRSAGPCESQGQPQACGCDKKSEPAGPQPGPIGDSYQHAEAMRPAIQPVDCCGPTHEPDRHCQEASNRQKAEEPSLSWSATERAEAKRQAIVSPLGDVISPFIGGRRD